jgi:hypothetical protein
VYLDNAPSVVLISTNLGPQNMMGNPFLPFNVSVCHAVATLMLLSCSAHHFQQPQPAHYIHYALHRIADMLLPPPVNLCRSLALLASALGLCTTMMATS